MTHERRFVEDCVAYLAGLVSPAEVLPVARQQRDRMLSRVVADALQRQLDALSPRDLGRAMQARHSHAFERTSLGSTAVQR